MFEWVSQNRELIDLVWVVWVSFNILILNISQFRKENRA